VAPLFLAGPKPLVLGRVRLEATELDANIRFIPSLLPTAIDIVLPVHPVDTNRNRDGIARLFHIPVDVVVIADKPPNLPVQLRFEGEMPVDGQKVFEQRLVGGLFRTSHARYPTLARPPSRIGNSLTTAVVGVGTTGWIR
jgi:hypothetical protein